MCGRYVNVASTADLTSEFEVEETVGEDLPPSWNIAPTDPVRAIMKRRRHGRSTDATAVRQLRTLRWGLVPNWSKTSSGGAKMINARVETVTTKPAFKSAAARRRCLCPALGYYEWQRTDTARKVAHFLHGPDDELLAFAGLYELWPNPILPDDDPDKWLWTCTIITQPATDLLGHIHDRCPVIVPAQLQEAWLDCGSDDPQVARSLLAQMPEARLQPDVVSTAVGNVRNNGPELIEPAAPAVAAQQQLNLPS
jgi:putative SOS response-associated peptidase YedK